MIITIVLLAIGLVGAITYSILLRLDLKSETADRVRFQTLSDELIESKALLSKTLQDRETKTLEFLDEQKKTFDEMEETIQSLTDENVSLLERNGSVEHILEKENEILLDMYLYLTELKDHDILLYGTNECQTMLMRIRIFQENLNLFAKAQGLEIIKPTQQPEEFE